MCYSHNAQKFSFSWRTNCSNSRAVQEKSSQHFGRHPVAGPPGLAGAAASPRPTLRGDKFLSQPSALSRLWRQNWALGNVLALALLLVLLYAPVLGRLALQWWEDPNSGHGFLVPVFAGYALWRERHRWQRLAIEPANFGAGVMLAGVALLVVGTLGAELFLSRLSLLVLLGGIVIFLGGWKVLRAVAFPLGYLVLMIPLPGIVYNEVTFPLQLQASRLAAASLELLRIPVLREGNLLYLPNYTLEVVEACSGIRSLMSLMALAVAYGYLVESPRWIRIALVGSMFPIAVAANSLRVVLTGVLAYQFGPSLAEGFFHFFSGWLIFVTAFVFMLWVHWVLVKVNRRRGQAAHA